MATTEGKIRQSSDSPVSKFELTMLTSNEKVIGYSVTKRDERVLVETERGYMPVFSFKMESSLQNLLEKYQGVWDV